MQLLKKEMLIQISEFTIKRFPLVIFFRFSQLETNELKTVLDDHACFVEGYCKTDHSPDSA